MIGSGLIWQCIKWHKILGDRLAMRLFDKPLPPTAAREEALIAELRASLSPQEAAHTLPKWVEFRAAFHREFSSRDPREFLRWPLIQHTMCVTNSPSIVRELVAMRGSDKWSARYEPATREVQCGHPVPFLYKPGSSGNLLHHCHHIVQLERTCGVDVTKLDTVVEFGGGYGSLCRLVHNLGFHGRYVIYDLPEFSTLQRFFLRSIDLPVRDAGEDFTQPGIYLLTDLAAMRRAAQSISDPGRALFIATWSLSESPVELRELFLPLVSEFGYYLFAYQSKFGPVDNLKYFREYSRATGREVEWTYQELRHLPLNHYLFGKRRRVEQ